MQGIADTSGCSCLGDTLCNNLLHPSPLSVWPPFFLPHARLAGLRIDSGNGWANMVLAYIITAQELLSPTIA